jgi:cell shape-determining protein MreC
MISYQDREKKKKIFQIIKKIIFIGIIIFCVFLLRNILGNFMGTVGKPFVYLSTHISKPFTTITTYFRSKNSLQNENQILKKTNSTLSLQLEGYKILLDENNRLKKTLGIIDHEDFILGRVLSKPAQSPYDTILIDGGHDKKLVEGSLVYVEGIIPVGTIEKVFEKTSVVSLFSTSGVKTIVRLEETGNDVELVGRGGGNFELEFPRDASIVAGSHVYLPGYSKAHIATIGPIVSDARDPYQKVLLTSPININELTEVFISVHK